jgi:hypothetical protein
VVVTVKFVEEMESHAISPEASTLVGFKWWHGPCVYAHEPELNKAKVLTLCGVDLQATDARLYRPEYFTELSDPHKCATCALILLQDNGE